MNKIVKTNPADKWMQQGIQQHENFQRTFQASKEHALTAGIYFLSASQSVEHGEWGAFVDAYSSKISERTVRRYMEFASEVFAWVKAEQPKLVGEDKLRAAAIKMVLRSPKGYIALCRQLELMRKFGEYDEVKYRTKKLLGTSTQVEFDFDKLAASIDVLTHFGDENYSFKYPEGVEHVAYMTEVEAKLEAALKRVREIKQHGKPIEV